MRAWYGHPPDYYADMTEAIGRRGIWNIESVWVDCPLRGQGRARRMLNQIITDANAEGVELWLVLAPLEEQGITWERLKGFYESLGFEETGPYMIRKPQ